MRHTIVFLTISVTVAAFGQLRESRHPLPVDATSREIVDMYEYLTPLSLHDQRQQMWALSSAMKIKLSRYNVERYLRQHPELSAPQRQALNENIALITSPGWFDIQQGSPLYGAKIAALEQHKRHARDVFSPETIIEVFLRLGPEPIEFRFAEEESSNANSCSAPSEGSSIAIESTPRSEALDDCTCASYYECWYFGAGCHESWCTPVIHCGWNNDEGGWGRCKFG